MNFIEKGFTLLQQPTHFTCGQTCLASITHKSIREIVDFTGISGKINQAKILAVLKKFKIKHDKIRYSHCTIPKVKYALVQIRNRKLKMGHLLIKFNNSIYDPWYGKVFNIEKYTKKLMNGFVYNWYIKLY